MPISIFWLALFTVLGSVAVVLFVLFAMVDRRIAEICGCGSDPVAIRPATPESPRTIESFSYTRSVARPTYSISTDSDSDLEYIPEQREALPHLDIASPDEASTVPRVGSSERVGSFPKLDLSFVDVFQPSRPTEDRRGKLAKFEHEISPILPFLHVSGELPTRNLDKLRSSNITHIINCACSLLPCAFPEDFEYICYDLEDAPNTDLLPVVFDAVRQIDRIRKAGGVVLVHCQQGVSRSTSVCIAYLMITQRLSYEDAYSEVRKCRGITSPNAGFMCQLMHLTTLQQSVRTQPLVFRLLPYSPQTPIPMPKLYDLVSSRATAHDGFSIIHVSFFVDFKSSIAVIWVGSKANRSHINDAHEYLSMLSLFFGIVTEPRVYQQGEEGGDFAEHVGAFGLDSSEEEYYITLTTSGPVSIFSARGAKTPGAPRVHVFSIDEEVGEHHEVTDQCVLTVQNPRMYLWPSLEEITPFFTTEDLLDERVCVVVANEGKANSAVWVWIGDDSDELPDDFEEQVLRHLNKPNGVIKYVAEDEPDCDYFDDVFVFDD